MTRDEELKQAEKRGYITGYYEGAVSTAQLAAETFAGGSVAPALLNGFLKTMAEIRDKALAELAEDK